jgi:hypothetical protein
MWPLRSRVFAHRSGLGERAACADHTTAPGGDRAEGARRRAASPPQPTCSPCRCLPPAHLLRQALVAPRERRGGPPLRTRGPPRAPCLLPSGPPPPGLTASPAGFLAMDGRVEGRAVRPAPARDKPPQGHAPRARQRDKPSPAQATAPVANALLRPRRARTRWRNTPPAPGTRHGQRAHGLGPGGGEATRRGGGPTRIGSRGHPPASPHVPAMTKGPPAAACQDNAPGTRGPHPWQGQEWPHVLPPRLRARLEPRPACGGQLGEAPGHRLDGLPRRAKTGSASRRERGALPPAEGRQRLREGAALGPPQAWRREPPRAARADSRPRPFRGREGARPVPAVCGRHTGAAAETPHPLCPCAVAQPQGAPRVPIEASRLRPTVTAIALHAGRVHDAVLHPLGLSTAVEPTAIPARLLATDDAGGMG